MACILTKVTFQRRLRDVSKTSPHEDIGSTQPRSARSGRHRERPGRNRRGRTTYFNSDRDQLPQQDTHQGQGTLHDTNRTRGTYHTGQEASQNTGGGRGRGRQPSGDRGRGAHHNTNRARGTYQNTGQEASQNTGSGGGRERQPSGNRGRGAHHNTKRARGTYHNTGQEASQNTGGGRGRERQPSGDRGRGAHHNTNRARGTYHNAGQEANQNTGSGRGRERQPSGDRGRGSQSKSHRDGARQSNSLNYQQHRFGFKTLLQLQESDASETLLELINRDRGLGEVLNDIEMRDDMLKMMLRTIARVCDCRTLSQQLIKLFAILNDSCFLNEIVPNYLKSIDDDEVDYDLQQTLKDVIKILIALSGKMPNMILAHNLLYILKILIDNWKNTTSIIDDCITEGLKEIDDITRKSFKEAKEKRSSQVERNHDLATPPNNFRDIPVFPTTADINGTTPIFYRPNKIRGKYLNLEHYLDVQFRLLREDFVSPLRQGISDYLQRSENEGERTKRIADLRVYNDVNILCPVCTDTNLYYRLRFDIDKLARVNWEKSKRLIFGSLVCLSSDSFRTLHFATVGNREVNLLKKGLIDVTFLQDQDEISHLPANLKFVMVETTAYFEAYKHVLSGLQNTREDDFPFQKYIVSCDNQVDRPDYLDQGKKVYYDLRPLVDDSFVIRGDSRLEKPGTTIPQRTNHKFSNESKGADKVEIENPRSWPSKDLLHLDGSQFRAIFTALTSEFSITQGPPGTGKTYIGLKIVKALLHNQKLWNTDVNTGKEDHHPMLIVCFTNHALDQFLEGILGFFKGDVIRVGGRSESETLKPINLKNYRQKLRSNKDIPRPIFLAKINARKEMNNIAEEINDISARIATGKTEILHESVLQKYMGANYEYIVCDHQMKMLCAQRRKGRMSAILEWLKPGLTSIIDQNQAEDVSDPSQESHLQQTTPEDLIDVFDDNVNLLAQRLIDVSDDEDDSRGRRRQVKKVEIRSSDIALKVSEIAKQLDFKGENEWMMTKKQKKDMKRCIRRELSSEDCMNAHEARMTSDILNLAARDRWRLYRYWVKCYTEELRDQIRMKEREFEAAAKEYQELLMEEDGNILRYATVIGMTTTCAARYQSILQEISPRIVVVEEAAEVLEAHIITTLSRECQHLVLIGDHQQLKPNPTVYDLAQNFNLDISLFERMVKNELQFETLQLQHRMRPRIADIMRHIYPKLKDHATVDEYEHIKGISEDIYFINHTQEEDSDQESTSHSNQFEAQYIVALCKYFLLQGYQPNSITILSMYSGQLFSIRKMMPKALFSGVKVTTVDNYQGEENDIVLLSLVRSNRYGNVGFVKIVNRVCVALSRARKGLYVIGNFSASEFKKGLWKDILLDMKQKDLLVTEICLCCQNHPNDKGILISVPQDFNKAPEGGCMKPCKARLLCGHECTKVCHILDNDHKQYKCRKPCARKTCKNGHECQKKCFEKCGDKCMFPVDKVIPHCGHMQKVPCSTSPNQFTCEHHCSKRLMCGHRCQERCCDPHTPLCQELVEKTCPCGNAWLVACCEQESALCLSRCNTLLTCGDICTGTCGECLRGKVHVPCSNICHNVLVCGHECMDSCAKNACPPCQRACENRCTHSKCQKRCGELCIPCNEPCDWHCKHYKCSKKCNEICFRQRCNEPCPKTLKCGHTCCGICGEPCPSKCIVCDRKELTEIFFGTEEEPGVKFVELEDCGHVLESGGLDHYMDDVDCGDIQMKLCPLCKTPIRRNLRYGNVIKRTLHDIEKVKKRMIGSPSDISELSELLQGQLMSELSDADSAWLTQKYLINSNHNQVQSKRLLTTMSNIVSLLVKVEEMDQYSRRICGKYNHDLFELKASIKRDRQFISDQEIEEIQVEMKRIALKMNFTRLMKLLKTKDSHISSNLSSAIEDVVEIFHRGMKLADHETKKIQRCLSFLQTIVPGHSLGISMSEKTSIIKAMGLSKGHWFKCKNGHIYAIGECGGATEEGVCPECNEGVGGTSHRLRGDNQLATEMDGATAAAWPTALYR
ncbi:hypothetical protein ScPMuIL_017560 [Solemya velum]